MAEITAPPRMDNRLSCAALLSLVRTVPDFPSPGIQFRDITTLIGHGHGLASTIDHLTQRTALAQPDLIAGVEARGFIFGAAVAAHLGVGFLPVRKPGKLPVETISISYDLEYGQDRLEIDPTAVKANQRVVIIDDLIATGGTANAATQLLRRAGAIVNDALFVIDLPDLGGADVLRKSGLTVDSLMQFAGD